MNNNGCGSTHAVLHYSIIQAYGLMVLDSIVLLHIYSKLANIALLSVGFTGIVSCYMLHYAALRDQVRCDLFIQSFIHCVTAAKAGLPNIADQLKINGSQVGGVVGQGKGGGEEEEG